MATDALAAPFNGTWKQGALSGDIKKWLQFEGVSMIHQGVLWTKGYGKDQAVLSLLIDDGRLYNSAEILNDDFNKFRYSFPLDGTKTPFMFAEGAPIMPLRNFTISATMTEQGVIEATLKDDKDNVHSKSRRYVSGDGKELKTEATFFGKPEGELDKVAKPPSVQITHHREEEPRLTLEACRAWCPNVLLDHEATQEKKQCVVTLPIEKFADADALLAALEKGGRNPKEPAEGAKQSLVETSATEFKLVIEKASGETDEFATSIDHEAKTYAVTYKAGTKVVGTWFLQALSEPVRVRGWCTLDNPYVAQVSASTGLQSNLDRALALS